MICSLEFCDKMWMKKCPRKPKLDYQNIISTLVLILSYFQQCVHFIYMIWTNQLSSTLTYQQEILDKILNTKSSNILKWSQCSVQCFPHKHYAYNRSKIEATQNILFSALSAHLGHRNHSCIIQFMKQHGNYCRVFSIAGQYSNPQYMMSMDHKSLNLFYIQHLAKCDTEKRLCRPIPVFAYPQCLIVTLTPQDPSICTLCYKTKSA